MGTRSNIQFRSNGERYQIYKHWDGYPSGTIPELQQFLKWNEGRNDDISYCVGNYFLFMKMLHAMNVRSTEHNKDILAMFKDPISDDLLHTGFGIVEVTNKVTEEWLYIVDLDKQTIQIEGSDHIIGFTEKLSKKKIEALEK